MSDGPTERPRAVKLAQARMFRIAWTERDPVAAADLATSMSDARTALCLALGCSVDEVDPVSGHDLRRTR